VRHAKKELRRRRRKLRKGRRRAQVLLRLSATAGLTAALALVSTPSPSGAFDRNQTTGCSLTNSFTWYFDSTHAFTTTTKQNDVRAGIAAWNSFHGPTGSAILASTEYVGSSPPPGSVKVRNVPLGGSQGTTTCGNGGHPSQIDIDQTQSVSDIGLQNIASHEAGHAHGLPHTGAFDDLSGPSSEPYMTTCGDVSLARTLTSDDVAAVLYREYGYSTAGDGYENGLTYWLQSPSGAVTLQTASPYDGHDYARISPGSGYYVGQIVRSLPVANPYFVDFAYKTNGSSTSSYKLYYRDVSYDTTTQTQCQWPNNWDMNNPHVGAEVQIAPANSVPVSSSWTTYTGVGINVPGSHDAIDLDVRVYNGSGGYLFVDDLRVI
jgi:hypothetical protein